MRSSCHLVAQETAEKPAKRAKFARRLVIDATFALAGSAKYAAASKNGGTEGAIPQRMTLKRIAVGCDLSEGSREALGYAVALARRHEATIDLISVTTVPSAESVYPAKMTKAAENYTRRATELLAQHRAELEQFRERAAAGAVKVSTTIVPGFADRDVAKTASELEADLLVVGTHGRGFWNRLLIGSVAERTARTFEKSVLVTRGDHHQADGGFHRVMVAADLSPQGVTALTRALELAAPKAAIELVHAWHDSLTALSLDPGLSMGAEPLWDELEASIRSELAAMVSKVPDAASHQPPIEIRAVLGATTRALVERAQAFKADLVVVGGHSHRGVARFLLGSTAEAMLRHAPCSVLIAR